MEESNAQQQPRIQAGLRPILSDSIGNSMTAAKLTVPYTVKKVPNWRVVK